MQHRQKTNIQKFIWNILNIQKLEKTNDPDESHIKLPLKRNENTKTERNEHRKLSEMSEKQRKMAIKNTYERYNTFKKAYQTSDPEENWRKFASKQTENTKIKWNEHKN